MAPAAEDVLGELYAWDSEIEDDSALAADDPKRDEDKVEDAYEQIIHTASGDASDVVLSLAAQLLHKHFFRFPHVQINVVEVLLQLCGPARSQAVRIHTLRALLQIVKTPPATAAASTPTSATSIARKNTRMWLQRIDKSVLQLLETESSSVIVRQVTPLRQALEERLQTDLDAPKSFIDQSTNQTSPESSRKKPRDEKEASQDAPMERESKKPKHEDEARYPSKEGKIVQLNRDASSNGTPRNGSDEPLWKKQLLNGRPLESEGRRHKVNAFSPRNCPPCPYLFLGSVPRHTPNAEIVEFLSPVWPEIDSMSVQIKQPDHNATAYAFVSMPTIEHAREAIHYVNANKFRGRAVLNANFARGPPVDTVLFVERTGEDVNMEDKDAVREFDFNKCDPEIWDGMCQQLERFGPLAFAEKGCVRFRNVEHAKSAIRKQLFTVKGYEIFPVYDTKEQFAIDSTRRGANVHNKQGFTLKSGRLVGGDADYRSSKNHRYREDDDPMDGMSAREHDRVASLKYVATVGVVEGDEVVAEVVAIDITGNSLTEGVEVEECTVRNSLNVAHLLHYLRLLFIVRLHHHRRAAGVPHLLSSNRLDVNVVENLQPVVVSLHIHRHHRRCFKILMDRDQQAHLIVMSLILLRLITAVVNPVTMSDATTRAVIEVVTIKVTAVTEASGKDKLPRPKNVDDSESQKEMKSGGTRMARDELFAGMDDLTVDYEEDDE
ncbi:hypothetical protein PHMEG_0007728 [Phytophthora megakarya]|uniref:RRM domain-containing protein n=1 Tax=Phytophthora megakarya TaxID=4795 RepID=A0A225WLR2_9STRA|nr:hypothetical protein PHMEG_0007728 [Phytophthora megakarya]